LLTNKTILAHGIHLDDSEKEKIIQAGSGISHCPNSNCSLGAGSLDIVAAKKLGLKVGLGTDCSGGYAPSIIDAMR
jgi:guanine deaminase